MALRLAITIYDNTESIICERNTSELNLIKIKNLGQDGSTGKHSSPPRTAMSKQQLNYRATIPQNHQKSR